MFDLAGLHAAVAARGRVARVVVAAVEGSGPREAGAAMLVWDGGQAGTIGGGALEWQAAAAARAQLAAGQQAAVARVPLGPALGQCCGGRVTLVTELWDAGSLAALDPDLPVARRVEGAGERPLAVARLLARARGEGVAPATVLLQGWLVEPSARPARALWLWGAGHVGRAIAGVLAPLPEFAITWVDAGRDRFPEALPEGVDPLWARDPAVLAERAPAASEHLVLTYSHALDLELCHRLLTRGVARIGLIGSATKWARFRGRLRALGHAEDAILGIDCPIGDPRLGKHPQAIALGVATALLARGCPADTARAAAPTA